MKMITKVKFQDKEFEFIKVSDNIWELQSDIDIRLSEKHHCSLPLKINKGFLTDFRTGPKLLDKIVPKKGMWYVIHDCLYQIGISGCRAAADNEQHYWMKECRVPFFTRMAITAGVKLFGQPYWDYYRNGGTFPKS